MQKTLGGRTIALSMTGYLIAFKKKIGYLQIFMAAVIWGSYGLFVRALDYSPEYILFYRFLFGLLGLLAFIAIRDGLASMRPSLTHWKLMLVPAAINCLSFLAYTYAINFTSVANAAFLIYTAPVFTVFFAPLMLKEKLEFRTILALIICLLGTAAIMGYGGLFNVGLSLLGDFIALLGGMTYGFLALFLKRVPLAVLGPKSNTLSSGYIALALLPFVLFSSQVLTWNSFLLLMFLGLLQQAMGTTLFHLGLRKVQAQHAGILTYAEPLSATVMAALFLYEGITPGSILGGALIITGGLIVILKDSPKPVGKVTV